jgi:hypothetical protein
MIRAEQDLSLRTGTYLQGIDTQEIIEAIHSRRPPTIPASAGLRL